MYFLRQTHRCEQEASLDRFGVTMIGDWYICSVNALVSNSQLEFDSCFDVPWALRALQPPSVIGVKENELRIYYDCVAGEWLLTLPYNTILYVLVPYLHTVDNSLFITNLFVDR